MALQTFVKVSRVSNLSDARYCAGMGVNQLGFNFNPQVADAITPETFLEIKNWIAGVQFVGEFDDMDADQISSLQKNIPVDLIELSNLEAVEPVNLLGKPLSFQLHINHKVDLNEMDGALTYLDELVEQVVIHLNDPDLFDVLALKLTGYSGHLRLLKAYRPDGDKLSQISHFHGIQLEGSKEDQPGYKDYDNVMDVLEALEAEED